MHQYVYTGKGGTIHSSSQLKWCGNDVNNRSIKIDGGRQRLTTPDGRGLPYITMRPFTDEEFEELPHILWTSEDDWDPTSLDTVISNDPNLYKAEPSPPLPDPMYDEYGEFRGHSQKLHSHAYTRAMVCSFVSFTYCLIYLRRWIAKKIRL
jgi:hypothetical protein